LFKNNKEEFLVKTCGTQVIEEDVKTTLDLSETLDGTITDKWSKNKFKLALDQLNIKSTCTEEDVTEEITIKNICVLDTSIWCTEQKPLVKST
jgi:hypothetical protein